MENPASEYDIAHQYQQEISADKVLLIHRHIPLILAANLVASIPLGLALWDIKFAIEWLISIYLLSLIRWFHYRTLDHKSDIDQIMSQGKIYIIFGGVSGCIWGFTMFLFFDPQNIQTFSFIIVTLAGIVSGSLHSLSPRPQTYAIFSIPATAPLALVTLIQGQTFYFWMGVATIGFMIVMLGISRATTRSVHESLLLKYENLHLVQVLKDQTQELEGQNKKIVIASEDKSRFLAAASHDLRQPLHAINLFTETLNMKITETDQLQDLERIRRGLDSLGELFDALLDISRLDSATTPISKVNFKIDELLQKLDDQFSVGAQAKGLSLDISKCDETVVSDPILLERLIGNLLSNAIRYTKIGTINIFFKKENDERLCIHIQDSGIGIPQENFDDIFNEFFQLHNFERDRNKGLGLGLAIVQRISRLLDLTLSVHSELDKGTEFILQLPLGEATAPIENISSNQTSTENNLKNLQVMVVDNEIDILDGMQRLLQSWECSFTGVDATDKAIKMIEDGFRPDFLISDYRMPGDFNGCELIHYIRNTVGDLPAIVISCDTGPEIMNEIKKSGVTLLSKPIKPAQIRLTMIRNIN